MSRARHGLYLAQNQDVGFMKVLLISTSISYGIPFNRSRRTCSAGYLFTQMDNSPPSITEEPRINFLLVNQQRYRHPGSKNLKARVPNSVWYGSQCFSWVGAFGCLGDAEPLRCFYPRLLGNDTRSVKYCRPSNFTAV